MRGILKVLCLLHTVLPLRVINQGPKLKLSVEALISSSKTIGDIALITGAFFFSKAFLGWL